MHSNAPLMFVVCTTSAAKIHSFKRTITFLVNVMYYSAVLFLVNHCIFIYFLSVVACSEIEQVILQFIYLEDSCEYSNQFLNNLVNKLTYS